MFIEYDWAFECYRVRFGDVFTDWRGFRMFASLDEATDVLSQTGNRVGRKVASRTWAIE